MNISRFIAPFLVFGLAGFMSISCGEKHSHDHATEKAADRTGGHDHEAEGAGGASFEPGKGVLLTDETLRSIGLETVEVIERKLPLELRFAAQVFREDHGPKVTETYPAECNAKAAGLLAESDATQIRPGTTAQIVAQSGESRGGVVLGLNNALAIGDVEVLVGITNVSTHLKPGDFLSVVISIARDQNAVAVPKSAVLRSAEGTFAYTQKGEAYLRIPIKTGAEADGFVEVVEGLLKGDVVVTKPVEKLWLIELRATKGGGHSH
jgi:hypothetical protein